MAEPARAGKRLDMAVTWRGREGGREGGRKGGRGR